MSSLRAGQMNRRITLQRPSTAQDTYGGPVRTWTDLGTFWAEIQPLSGRELESAQR
ncbi:MAG: head-tail adaptor protein, partial [Betaproteobacteria bacterium]|nr:head-tail adaptor protein [Betaproteobacteria bacterium]